MRALAQDIVERLMNCWNVAEKLGALLHRGLRLLRRQPEKALVERANLGRWALQEDPLDAVPCLMDGFGNRGGQSNKGVGRKLRVARNGAPNQPSRASKVNKEEVHCVSPPLPHPHVYDCPPVTMPNGP